MSAHAIWMTLFGRRERSANDDVREKILTVATALTILRAIVSSVLFILAIANDSHRLLIVALGVSMIVDFLDGFVARSRQRETLIGAQLDGLADRLAACFVFVGMVVMQRNGPQISAAAIVWLQFGIVDQFFSNQFLRFGLWSPDHFYAIDEKVWRRTFSPIAKLANNIPVALLAVGSWYVWPAATLSVALIIVRVSVYSAIREKARQHVVEKHFAQRLGDTGESGWANLNVAMLDVEVGEEHEISVMRVVPDVAEVLKTAEYAS